jgi:hypothetical protein
MNPKRRHNRMRKVKHRRKLVKLFDIENSLYGYDNPRTVPDGYLENNNLVTHWKPKSAKTKTKNAGYKHKGWYGCSAFDHTLHDRKAIERMNHDEDEYFGKSNHRRNRY